MQINGKRTGSKVIKGYKIMKNKGSVGTKARSNVFASKKNEVSTFLACTVASESETNKFGSASMEYGTVYQCFRIWIWSDPELFVLCRIRIRNSIFIHPSGKDLE
jgi:hypothetical protein